VKQNAKRNDRTNLQDDANYSREADRESFAEFSLKGYKPVGAASASHNGLSDAEGQ
jgi:hypothetical protein